MATWQIKIQPAGNSVTISYPQIANRGFEVQYSSDLRDPNAWVPLDVAGNELLFSAENFPASVTDPVVGTNRFYRVRVLP